MSTPASKRSSGCESGWTAYLDQLPNSTDPCGGDFVGNYRGNGSTRVNEDQENEDLSMVSDASSGPPHLHENYFTGDTRFSSYSHSLSEDQKKRKHRNAKTKETARVVKKQPNLCLDDTASSPSFHFSQGNVTPENHSSQVLSATQFEVQGKSTPNKHLSLFKSSAKGKSGNFLGRKRQ